MKTEEEIYNVFVEHENENISEILKNSILEAMIVFAGNHVNKALKEANEQAVANIEESSSGSVVIYDSYSILNAYPLKNIK